MLCYGFLVQVLVIFQLALHFLEVSGLLHNRGLVLNLFVLKLILLALETLRVGLGNFLDARLDSI